MTNLVSPRIALLVATLALVACNRAADDADAVQPGPSPSAQRSQAPVAQPTAEPARQDFARTMPSGMRGDWHKDDLGRALQAQDCDPRLRGTIDWDRLITVTDTGYSYFETGGRITTVHDRSDTLIDATFDTTYADDPTSERRDFTLRPDGTMQVNAPAGDGRMATTRYIRCPR